MSTPDYVARVAELLALHGACAAKPGDRDRMTCGMLRPERHGATDLHVSHQAEVLAAAGLIPTTVEWGSRMTGDGPKEPRTQPRLVSRGVTDWKDATDD